MREATEKAEKAETTGTTYMKIDPLNTYCYKCKQEKAVINAREKACKNCFLSVVDYIFKNTLREKCLFKNKIQNSFCGKEFVPLINENTKEKKQENLKEITQENLKGCPKERTSSNKSENVSKGKYTAVAFSGGICSCFLLFHFIKYLKNYKNQKESSYYLKNEHAIFSTVLYVNVDGNEEYVHNLENVITNIWEMTKDEKIGCSNKHINEETSEVRDQNESNVNEKGGVWKKRIGMIDFVVLKGNYFIKENYKTEFQATYQILRKEKNSYYLDYIKEIIIFNNILKYCVNENINYVLFGNSANNISEKTFVHTVLGNGINIPLNVSYIDSRFSFNNIQLLKPLKDMLNKEIHVYCFFKNIKYLKEGKIVNILRKSVEEIISNLHEKNNAISVINNTTNNLLEWNICFNTFKREHKKQNRNNGLYDEIITNEQKEPVLNLRFLKTKHFSNFTDANLTTLLKETENRDFEFCYICLGNKETEEEKRFIKKMDKVQKENLSKMKFTHLVCSTCCSIFSSSFSFAEIYDLLF